MLAATSFKSQTYLFSDDRLTTSTDFLIIPFNYAERNIIQLVWKWTYRTVQVGKNDHNCDPRVTTRVLLPVHDLSFFRSPKFPSGRFFFFLPVEISGCGVVSLCRLYLARKCPVIYGISLCLWFTDIREVIFIIQLAWSNCWYTNFFYHHPWISKKMQVIDLTKPT